MAQVLILNNVKCYFPNLDTASAYQDKGTPSYSLKVLIPKTDKENLKKLTDYIKSTIGGVSKWSAAVKKQVLKVALDQSPDNNYCIIKDGDARNKHYTEMGEEDKVIEAYNGYIVVTLKRKQPKGRPLVVNPENHHIPVGEIKGSILNGSWVNVSFKGWVYDKPQKGYTHDLEAVQLVKAYTPESPFEAIEQADDSFDSDDEDVFGDE